MHKGNIANNIPKRLLSSSMTSIPMKSGQVKLRLYGSILSKECQELFPMYLHVRPKLSVVLNLVIDKFLGISLE